MHFRKSETMTIKEEKKSGYMELRAELVMIGTELLLGEIVDTNANKLSLALRDIGMDLYYKTTVGDNEQRIIEVLNQALDRSDVVITSGGIGPTVDDITRQAVAVATGRRLVYSEELERQIAERFGRIGREMAENNKRQAYLPEGALALENPVGTAPCFLSEDIRDRGFIIVLPGVPRELDHMMQNVVKPILIEHMGGIKSTRVRVLRTCAVGESNIDRVIGSLMTSSNPTVGLAAHAGQTDVRITAKADEEREADLRVSEMERAVREKLGVAIYGVGKETVAGVVGELLQTRGLKLNIADALTGGQLGRELMESGMSEVIGQVIELSVEEVCGLLSIQGISTGEVMASGLALHVASEGSMSLAVVGPLSERLTYVAVQGPDGLAFCRQGRNFQDSDHIRRWLVIQALDWVRRSLLGEMVSPAD
tara:strand:- start:6409 stop:7680 length:1272 start_codon:yes stop_codon:yes gene_type:complete